MYVSIDTIVGFIQIIMGLFQIVVWIRSNNQNVSLEYSLTIISGYQIRFVFNQTSYVH